jgi:hypothetical protein
MEARTMIALVKTVEGIVEAIPMERIIAVKRGERFMSLWVDYGDGAYPCFLRGDEDAIKRAFGCYLEHYGEKFCIWDLTQLDCISFYPGWREVEEWKSRLLVEEDET